MMTNNSRLHSVVYCTCLTTYLITVTLCIKVMASRIPDSHLQSPIRDSLRSFFTRPLNKVPKQFIEIVDSCPVNKDYVHLNSEHTYGIFLSKIYDEDIQISEWASDTYISALDAANDSAANTNRTRSWG